MSCRCARVRAAAGIECERDGRHRSDLADPRGPAIAERMFRRPTQAFVEARAEACAPTFRYEFRWESTAAPGIGSAHSLDVPFIFNTLRADGVEDFTGPHPPQHLADEVHEAFARFARVGDPGGHAGHVSILLPMSSTAPAQSSSSTSEHRSVWRGPLGQDRNAIQPCRSVLVGDDSEHGAGRIARDAPLGVLRVEHPRRRAIARRRSSSHRRRRAPPHAVRGGIGIEEAAGEHLGEHTSALSVRNGAQG